MCLPARKHCFMCVEHHANSSGTKPELAIRHSRAVM